LQFFLFFYVSNQSHTHTTTFTYPYQNSNERKHTKGTVFYICISLYLSIAVYANCFIYYHTETNEWYCIYVIAIVLTINHFSNHALLAIQNVPEVSNNLCFISSSSFSQQQLLYPSTLQTTTNYKLSQVYDDDERYDDDRYDDDDDTTIRYDTIRYNDTMMIRWYDDTNDTRWYEWYDDDTNDTIWRYDDDTTIRYNTDDDNTTTMIWRRWYDMTMMNDNTMIWRYDDEHRWCSNIKWYSILLY